MLRYLFDSELDWVGSSLTLPARWRIHLGDQSWIFWDETDSWTMVFSEGQQLDPLKRYEIFEEHLFEPNLYQNGCQFPNASFWSEGLDFESVYSRDIITVYRGRWNWKTKFLKMGFNPLNLGRCCPVFSFSGRSSNFFLLFGTPANWIWQKHKRYLEIDVRYDGSPTQSTLEKAWKFNGDCGVIWRPKAIVDFKYRSRHLRPNQWWWVEQFMNLESGFKSFFNALWLG